MTPQPQTPTHRQIVATATAKMIGMIADPNLPAGHLASLATLDLSDLSGRMPSAFWRILGGALPIELQEDTESGERNNWAALMKIIAIAVAKGLVGAGAARPLPIGHALREANFNERRFFHLVSTPSREDMRVTLTDSVRQFADKGIAFDIQEAAQLLLLDYPDRDQALEKLDRDWNMARKGA